MGLKGFLAAALCAAGLAAAPAEAATIGGGTTRVLVTADLAGLGIAPSLLGSASFAAADPLTVDFPITGGALPGGPILHEGSGVLLTRQSNTLALANFIIDLVDEVIRADVTPNGGSTLDDVAILAFDLASVSSPDPFDLSDPDLALTFTEAASQAIVSVLGLNLAPNALAGVQFGLAATDPSEVPLPAAAWLFLAGGVALAARRRKAHAPL